MILTQKQSIALNLAGTVALPSPPPATANIRIQCTGEFAYQLWEAYNQDSELPDELLDALPELVLLKIVHAVSPKLTITRLLPLSDLRAAFIPADCKEVDFNQGAWFHSHQLHLAAVKALVVPGENSRDLDEVEVSLFADPAIVYLPETVPLLMQVEVGLTAAESADYYPPTPYDQPTRCAVHACGPKLKWSTSTLS